MKSPAARRRRVDVVPVTPERWKDLVALFGARGACGGCWCMFFKRTGPELAAGRGSGNRSALRRCVAAGSEPGLLAYVDGVPAGWCSVEPKRSFSRIMKSRKLGASAGEETPTTWAVPCLFVDRAHRGKGLSVELLRAAAEHARRRGATRVEGYPVVPRGRMPDTFAYHGTVAAFEKAGFEVVAAPSASRRIVARRV